VLSSAVDPDRAAAVAGIGWSDISRNSGRSELHLALEAIRAALTDAGIRGRDVDGYVTYDRDSNNALSIISNIGVRNLSYWGLTYPGGGGACATVNQAAMAIATRQASVVLIVRALNGRSGQRYGRAPVTAPARITGINSHYGPYGISSAGQRAAIIARRYMHEYGATSEDFGRFAIAARKHAGRNPNAVFRNPLTLEEHQASRMIADPLHLYDCCTEVDGGCAVIVTSLTRARDLQQRPVRVLAAAQGTGAGARAENVSSYNRPRITESLEARAVGESLFRQTGLQPSDVQVAQIYDHFTPLALMTIEALGFCGRGEAGGWISGGRIEWPDGNLPMNTSGGLLSEGYIHGMNLVVEGVRQIRGTSYNQVTGARVSLVCAGMGVPTSGVIFGSDA
jgi:acetyl-CoA acetyltransferase